MERPGNKTDGVELIGTKDSSDECYYLPIASMIKSVVKNEPAKIAQPAPTFNQYDIKYPGRRLRSC